MDKKIRNRIIYVTTACLWGIAMYRTWQNYQVEEQTASTEIVSMPSISPMKFGKDTFQLELPDQDPFLQSSWTPVVQNNVSKNEPPKTDVKKEVEKPVVKAWPRIEYFGFVKNRNQNSTLCLLKIDGKQIQLNKGQQYNGLIVQNAFKDSVCVMFEGELKTIRK